MKTIGSVVKSVCVALLLNTTTNITFLNAQSGSVRSFEKEIPTDYERMIDKATEDHIRAEEEGVPIHVATDLDLPKDLYNKMYLPRKEYGAGRKYSESHDSYPSVIIETGLLKAGYNDWATVVIWPSSKTSEEFISKEGMLEDDRGYFYRQYEGCYFFLETDQIPLLRQYLEKYKKWVEISQKQHLVEGVKKEMGRLLKGWIIQNQRDQSFNVGQILSRFLLQIN